MKRSLWIFSLLFLSAIAHAALTPEAIDEGVKKKNKSKAFAAELVKTLEDSQAGIQARERAAWALGQLDLRSGAPALIKAAQHKGLLIRSAALDSLVRMRARSALTTFTEIATADPILSLRQRATLGLGLLQWEKTIDALVKLSEDPEPEIRGASTLAMAATHSQKNDFSQVMKEMQRDASVYVQERATKGLELIRGKKQAIQQHLKSADSDIRLFAALFYHSYGNSTDLRMLKDAWNVEGNDDVRHELDLAIRATKKRAAAAEKVQKEKALRPAKATKGPAR